ncbi:hypothetical protein BJF79_04395 [Actinomadura sp. CNU-125]|nr:hypothetical protein BJF79_04395 [Actinomadura sp. CNU-125]
MWCSAIARFATRGQPPIRRGHRRAARTADASDQVSGAPVMIPAAWTTWSRVVVQHGAGPAGDRAGDVTSGTPPIPTSSRMSSDSLGVMYGARRPVGEVAGYHRATTSSRALTDGTQGSVREPSLR